VSTAAAVAAASTTVEATAATAAIAASATAIAASAATIAMRYAAASITTRAAGIAASGIAAATVAVSAAIPVAAAIAIAAATPSMTAPAVPRSDTDEDAAVKPVRAVIAVRCAGVGVIGVIAPLAIRGTVGISGIYQSGADTYPHPDLGIRRDSGERKNNKHRQHN
jgi:hypothetical protein